MSRRASGDRNRALEDGRGQDGPPREERPEPAAMHGWKYALSIEGFAAERPRCQELRLVQYSWADRTLRVAIPEGPAGGARARLLVERARAWVERYADDEALSVTALASALHMSRTSLHRKLVAGTGLPPGEFIRSVRLQLARRLLLEGSSNVSEAAYAVGFVSLSGFSRAYRSQYGEPPSSSRQRGAAAGGCGAAVWNSSTNS